MRNLLALGIAVGIGLAWAPGAVAQTQENPPANPPAVATAPLKTQTRLITIDVVVTDSHGAPIRGLKADDFRVFDANRGPQRITQFQFIDGTAKAKLPPEFSLDERSPGAVSYSNQSIVRLSVPPTILLMDALNTEIENQSEVHQHMLKLLKTLPTSTPIAVFVLGHTLRIVQGFTTDPTLLRAAVDKSLHAQDIEGNPQDDPNSASNVALAFNGDTETPAVQALEQFEQMAYVQQTTVRVDETTDAMIAIAKYLSGYPGRKNLLWFSSAFPIWINPTSDAGGNPALGLNPSTTKIPGQEFENSASYDDKVHRATQRLADAQVAVYPVDARGLQTDQIYTTAQSPRINRFNPGASMGAQVSRQQGELESEQATMDAVAEATGGKTCKNTNDLAGCVEGAIADSSAYYELGYSPDGIVWDGKYHRIGVKLSAHGAKLRYRDGYFATDETAVAKESPVKALQRACSDVLPSTAIPLMVQPIAQGKNSQQTGQDAGQVRYLLTIPREALSFASDAGARRLGLQMALCEYDPKEESFRLFPRDLSQPVPDSVYKGWQATGLRDIFDYGAKPEDQRIRFAVLDTLTGAVGAVDAPAHPTRFASLPTDLASSPGVSPSGTSAAAPKPPAQIPIKFTFRAGSVSSELDWSGDKLWYHGDLGINSGAPAFFQTVWGSSYHCDSGKMVPNDPQQTNRPGFSLRFRSPAAGTATVEIDGEAPVYGGNLPVDSTARAFFDYVWKLVHCQQP